MILVITLLYLSYSDAEADTFLCDLSSLSGPSAQFLQNMLSDGYSTLILGETNDEPEDLLEDLKNCKSPDYPCEVHGSITVEVVSTMP